MMSHLYIQCTDYRSMTTTVPISMPYSMRLLLTYVVVLEIPLKSSALSMVESKITPSNSKDQQAKMESPEIGTKAEIRTEKQDAIARKVYLLAFITHMGKRLKSSNTDQKKCVFSPNVIALTRKLGQRDQQQCSERILRPRGIRNTLIHFNAGLFF